MRLYKSLECHSTVINVIVARWGLVFKFKNYWSKVVWPLNFVTLFEEVCTFYCPLVINVFNPLIRIFCKSRIMMENFFRYSFICSFWFWYYGHNNIFNNFHWHWACLNSFLIWSSLVRLLTIDSWNVNHVNEFSCWLVCYIFTKLETAHMYVSAVLIASAVNSYMSEARIKHCIFLIRIW